MSIENTGFRNPRKFKSMFSGKHLGNSARFPPLIPASQVDMEEMKIGNDGIADRPIAPRGALPPDALPTGADGSPAAAVTAAPPHPQPQPQPQPQPHPPPSRPRYMLSRTGRSCALMCDRTPDNARQEMLHARPRRDSLQVRPRRLRLQLCSGRGDGRRPNGCAASPGATRPGHPSSQKVAEVDTRV